MCRLGGEIDEVVTEELLGGFGSNAPAVPYPWPTGHGKEEPPSLHVGAAATAAEASTIVAGDSLTSIHFSGCGFMLPFHFGVAKAFMDADVKFETATASSGGVMAALAILGGADIDVGIRQCFDLRLEPAAMPWSFSSFFDMYRQYFRIFRPKEYQLRVPLSSLHDRLYVRLGAWTGNFRGDNLDKGVVQGKGHFFNRPWKIFQTTDFLSEKDLEVTRPEKHSIHANPFMITMANISTPVCLNLRCSFGRVA